MKFNMWLFLASFLFFSFACCKEEKQTHEIRLEIKITAPMSKEFVSFVKSIPDTENRSVDFEEWKNSFVNNMTKLIRLVESGQVNDSFWSVNTDVSLPLLNRQTE